MQNDPKAIEKAKKQLRKYRMWSTIVTIMAAICAFRIVYSVFPSLIAAAVFCFLVLVPLLILIKRIIFNKYIMDVINKELDAETFLAMIQLGKFDNSLAEYQLYGERFCGHYENVVGICKMKMSDPQIVKRHMGLYLVYLANVYFDIGDDENLRQICDRYNFFLAAESPRKQAKYIKKYKGMTFFEDYLKGDIKSCTEFLNKPVSTILEKHIYTFRRARLAHIQGNMDEARGYYESLVREVPQMSLGRLSAVALAKMEEQPAASDIKLMDIPEEPIYVSLYSAKAKRTVLTVLAVCLIVFAFGHAIISDLRSLEYEKEYDRAIESVRLLVEEDHDDVTVFDVFYLTKEDEIVDFMFICRTNAQIIVGCVYVSEDDSNDYHYKSMAIPMESLSDGFDFWHISFQSVTSHNQIESYFYGKMEDIPLEYYHLSTFEVNGRSVYFVVTEITPLSEANGPEISA